MPTAAVERSDSSLRLSECLETTRSQSASSSASPPPPPPPVVSEGRGRSGRSHRHRRRRSRSRNQRYRKQDERNLFAAVCSMVVMVLLCTAMADPQWFYIHGGGCARHTADLTEPVHYLGINQFFYLGQFTDTKAKDGHSYTSVYQYGESTSDTLVDCVTPSSMRVLRSLIGLCFVGVGFSLVAFLLDLAGPTAPLYRFIHRNAVFTILTVLVCVVVNGLSYWVVYQLEQLQQITKPHLGSRVVAQFGVSFYLVAAAGVMAVVATACNLLRRYGEPGWEGSGGHSCGGGRISPDDQQQLLGDYDGTSGGSSPEMEIMPSASGAPPPPYIP